MKAGWAGSRLPPRAPVTVAACSAAMVLAPLGSAAVRRPAGAESRPLPAGRRTDVDRHRIEPDPFVAKLGVRRDWGKKRRQRRGKHTAAARGSPCRHGSAPGGRHLRRRRARRRCDAGKRRRACWARRLSPRAAIPASRCLRRPSRSRDRTGPPPPGCALLALARRGPPRSGAVPQWLALATTLKPAGQVKPVFMPSAPGIAAEQTIVIGDVLPAELDARRC